MSRDQLQIALEHHRAGRLQQAEAGYRAVIGDDPAEAGAWHWLGLLYYQAGRVQRAIPLLQKAAALQPDDPAVLHNLGWAYQNRGRLDEAIGAFERAAAGDGTRGETLLGLGISRLTRGGDGDADAAVIALRGAVSTGLASADLYHTLGVALLTSGRAEEAIEALKLSLAEKPDSVNVYQHLATAYRCCDRARDVRKCLLKALELEPGSAKLWHDLASLDAETGNPAIAAGLFRKAIAADPALVAAYEGLAAALRQTGQDEEADEAMARARKEAEAAQKAPPPSTPPPAASDSDAVAEMERKLTATETLELHFALAAYKGLFSPSKVPAATLTTLFDKYAQRFDDHLRGQLKYQVPDLIPAAVVEAAGGFIAANSLDILDLGCGTGLCGPPLRPMARTLCGVDLAPNMIEKARERGVYDRLEVGDLVDAVKSAPRSFDLLVAADVFIYVGELAPVFEAAALCLRPGGYLAFSVEAGGGDRFQLHRTSRRFMHSKPYLDRMAAIFGFEQQYQGDIALRMEGGNYVAGRLLVLQLPAK